MVEKIYKFSSSEDKLIEKLIDDENLVLNHVVLSAEDSLPQHFSNSNVYLVIIRGEMAVELNEQAPNSYKAGSIVNIPYNTKMSIANQANSPLEFFIVKAPNPNNIE